MSNITGTRAEPGAGQARPAGDHRATVDGMFLRIEDCELLFSGSLRNVYQHPFDPSLLVKTIRPDQLDENGTLIARKDRWLNHLRPMGLYAVFMREIRAMIRYMRYNFPLITTPPPFSRVYGFAGTTHSIGLIVEKITSDDGSPARTLASIAREGMLTARHREQIDAFFDIVAREHIVFGDLHAGNLVYEDKGQGRFVCIDGFGEKTLIPIYEWSRRANTHRLHKLRRRVLAGVERAVARASQDEAGGPSI